mmetsp:Transcript_88504/g.129432  ORF Transcript_88504/g.129432 Transcript_88504/m.129432 type:complete len:214 (+) Transcript_88504:45-686(+)
MACSPAIRARGSDLPSATQRAAAVKKISRSIPEVPPMDSLHDSAIARSAPSSALGYVGMSSNMRIAPRFIVIPQSPSPATRSQAVSCASASISATAPAFTIAAVQAASPGPVSGCLLCACSPSLTTGAALWVRLCMAGQAGAEVGASRRVVRSGVRWSSDIEKPAMSMDVIKAPQVLRATTNPRALRHVIACRPIIASSIGVVAPRELMSKAT